MEILRKGKIERSRTLKGGGRRRKLGKDVVDLWVKKRYIKWEVENIGKKVKMEVEQDTRGVVNE